MHKKQVAWVTGALLLANIISGLDATIITTALPAIISDLNGIEYMGWIIAVFLLGMAISTPIWSKLGERTSNKFALQLSLVVFIVSSLLEGAATNIWFFLIARIFMGIGTGGMSALPYIVIGELYHKYYQRSKVLGYIAASWSAATIMGPLVGGWIVDALNWHWVFYINVPLGLITIIIIQKYYAVNKNTRKVHFDFKGSVYMIIGLSALLLGIQLIGMASNYWVAGLMIVGGYFLWRLTQVEKTAQDPIIPGRIFKNKPLVADFVLFSVAWGGGIAFSNYAPMWAQGLLATTALIGGVTQIPGAVTDLIGAQSAPRLQTRFRAGTINFYSLLLILISLVILIFAGVDASFTTLLISSCFFGLGTGLIFVVLQVKVQKDSSRQDMAIATSLSFLSRILAQTFMSSIYGVTMNQALVQGVKESKGKITIKMMNALSDPVAIKTLPEHLIPQMRNILHHGLHNIMIVAAVLTAIGMIYSQYAAKKHGANDILDVNAGD
ncbi:MFS transporter [Ligilactobacillus ceti]|uniref:Multidrug transporter n=1 Tax=Ligilactobacillus ceti DSM 22408 TaxID=1122146 RepID=A0A0R2KRX0_9LACO|nr:MFS transporter [Ligilactobacillus ceti]KRN89322.1 multidrug transporter [Ligilactobacillus ceti DSM 22408]